MVERTPLEGAVDEHRCGLSRLLQLRSHRAIDQFWTDEDRGCAARENPGTLDARARARRFRIASCIQAHSLIRTLPLHVDHTISTTY